MLIRPKVSVITPVYNAEKFLVKLVESVSNQKNISLEHILVDDCSTDNSLALLNSLALKYSFMKVISLPFNGGPVVARNLAIKEASGKFLAFLDADDYWLPNKCYLQSKFMQDSGAIISFTDYRFISEDGKLIGNCLKGPHKVTWFSHHCTRYLGCLTIMIDRENYPDFIFPQISPAYRAEDFLAWSKVLHKFNVAYRVPYDLARYRQVKSSRSSQPLLGSFTVWKLYRKVEYIPFYKSVFYFFVYIIFALLKRVYCFPRRISETIDLELSNEYKL